MPEVPLIDIRPDHWEIVRGILYKHVPQYEVWAFGSRAKWTAKSYSDLDLAVISGKPLSLSVSASLADDFSESDLPWKVDVVDWATTSPSFQKIIERDKVIVQEAGRGWVMAGEWNELPFSEAVLLNPATPLARGAVYPFVEMSAITAGTRDVNCSEHREFTGGGSRFQDRDTLMARITPCLENGKLARFQAPVGEPVGHGSTEFIVVRGRPNVTDNDYAYYLTISPEVRSFAISQMTGTSGRQRVPTDALGGIAVPLPPLAEQKAIAAVLGALDDKIELNRRMNETLEAMARTLFQSWFVDFDPVRAKMEGRKPAGLDAATAALFPAIFQDSKAGHIPKGWKVGVLHELINFVIGGDWGSTEPTDDESVSCYCIRGADIPLLQEGGIGKMPTRFLKPSSVEKRQLMDGDLAIEISGGSPTQCTGRPVLVSNGLLNSLGRPLVASNFCRIVKLKSPALSKFVYCWLRSLYDAGALFQFETGTTGIKNFAFVLFSEKYPLVVPDLRIAEAFDHAVSPFFSTIQSNAHQSRTLATLRDTLLPKLLSGELSVADRVARFDETAA